MNLLDNYLGLMVGVAAIAYGLRVMVLYRHIARRFLIVTIVVLCISMVGQVLLIAGVEGNHGLYEWIGHITRACLIGFILSEGGRKNGHAD